MKTMHSTSINCPSCNAETAGPAEACSQCGFQFRGEHAPAIVQPVRRAGKISASVHVALFIDRTGSTQAFDKGVPQATDKILDLIAAKARETKVSINTGGDLDYDEPCVRLADRVSSEAAKAEVARIVYGGGGDAAETHLDNIQEVLSTTPWEMDAMTWRNALILFMTADTKPARSGVTARALGEELKAKGVLLYAVAENYPFVRELVEAAEGLLFPISNDPDPAQLQQIASGISRSILITAAGTATRPMTVPMAS